MKLVYSLLFLTYLWLTLSLVRTGKPCTAVTGCNCLVSDQSVSCNAGVTDLLFNQSFNSTLGKKVVQTFDLTDNNNITKIPNLFSKSVSFVNINIRNVKSLTTIEGNAFWSSANITKTFRMQTTSVNSSHTLFTAISQLLLLTEVILEDNQFETIPDHAFSEHQKQLTFVVLTGNRIKHLGEYAFYGLKGLSFLDLGDNLVDSLNNNSLAIQNSNEKGNFPVHIRINFKINRISEISDQAFAKLNRSTNLDISFNNLTELRANAFKTILSYDSSKIIVKGNKVNCDCGINWIYSNKTIKAKFSGPLRCADKRYFVDLTDKDFKNCTKYYDDI